LSHSEVTKLAHLGVTKLSMIIHTDNLDNNPSFEVPGTIRLFGITSLQDGDIA
jgi:hypothetical protein